MSWLTRGVDDGKPSRYSPGSLGSALAVANAVGADLVQGYPVVFGEWYPVGEWEYYADRSFGRDWLIRRPLSVDGESS